MLVPWYTEGEAFRLFQTHRNCWQSKTRSTTCSKNGPRWCKVRLQVCLSLLSHAFLLQCSIFSSLYVVVVLSHHRTQSISAFLVLFIRVFRIFSNVTVILSSSFIQMTVVFSTLIYVHCCLPMEECIVIDIRSATVTPWFLPEFAKAFSFQWCFNRKLRHRGSRKRASERIVNRRVITGDAGHVRWGGSLVVRRAIGRWVKPPAVG